MTSRTRPFTAELVARQALESATPWPSPLNLLSPPLESHKLARTVDLLSTRSALLASAARDLTFAAPLPTSAAPPTGASRSGANVTKGHVDVGEDSIIFAWRVTHFIAANIARDALIRWFSSVVWDHDKQASHGVIAKSYNRIAFFDGPIILFTLYFAMELEHSQPLLV